MVEAPVADLRVVVLGGGACGMTAALGLARGGAQVTVLEREPRVGGLCGTQERSGFRFDLGGHRFLSKSRALEALVRDLVGDDLLCRTRSSVVIHGGRRFRYPLELDDVIRGAGPAWGARVIASYASERLRRRLAPRPDRSFEDWVVHRFGRELYGAFFGPYTEKLWGIPPSQISADWAAERISLPSLTDLLARLVGLRSGDPPRTYARRYLYPRLGIGQIFERMGDAITALGGTVRTSALVTGISVAAGRACAVRFDAGEGEREIGCDAVVATVALPLLARMIGAGRRGGLPLDVHRSASSLRFRGIRLLNVLLDRAEVSPHTWMYVSEPRFLAARIQEPRHRSPDAAPPGQTSLMLEIPCTVGDEVWSAPDDAIYDRCMDDLEQLGLRDLRAATVDHFPSFVVEGYPIYHLDYRRDRARVLDFASALPNLVTCGRQGGFRYIFMDTAMEMGLAAAAALLGRLRSSTVIADLGAGEGFIEARALTA